MSLASLSSLELSERLRLNCSLIEASYLKDWKAFCHNKIQQIPVSEKALGAMWRGFGTVGPVHVLRLFEASNPQKAREIYESFLKTIENPLPPPSPSPTIIEGEVKVKVDKTPDPPIPPAITDITDKINLVGRHRTLGSVKKLLRRRRYPLLWGPPGTGKTHVLQQVAQDMELPHLIITLTQDSMRSELLGAKSPVNGEVIKTLFRDLWINGGVIIIDEVGLASAGLVNMLNSALAQRVIAYPDGVFDLHPNCFIVFADNSNLRGGDSLFPERQDLGGAFRDRLSYVHFQLDAELELKILSTIFGSKMKAMWWQSGIVKVREILREAEVPLFASPRFAFRGAEDFLDGFIWPEIVQMELFQGLDEDTLSLVKPKILEVFK